ncbi:MAG: YraN family protein [Actinomycetes bacterium]
MRAKDGLGRYGERVAERHLQELGMVVLDRNWRCAEGELDLVARDGDELVACEVKTRSSLAAGHPFEAVTPVKLARLHRLARAWARAHDLRVPVRVDIVGVLQVGAGAAQVEYLKNAG